MTIKVDTNGPRADWCDQEADVNDAKPPVVRVVPSQFNINEYVWVQVNERGFKLLEQQDAEIERLLKGSITRVEHLRDEQRQHGGWSKWQMWSLMRDFGAVICLGCLPPFGTTIRFSAPEVCNGR